MSPRLRLHIPGIRDMAYREKLLAQPKTMAYNRGLMMDAEGYDPATGCIAFPPSDWRFWRDVWLYREPDRFSAYLLDEDSGVFVGEACYYADPETGDHAPGILIEHCHRGQGYATEGLKLIVQRAMTQPEVQTLSVLRRSDDIPALRLCRAAGFVETNASPGFSRLTLTRTLWQTQEALRQHP